MYIPRHFEETRVDVLHQLMRNEPFGALVTLGSAGIDYLDAQMRGIVGVEMVVTRLAGKWKVSQNRGEADRAGVTTGLRADADPASAVMADLIERRS